MSNRVAFDVKKYHAGDLQGVIRHVFREKNIDTNPDINPELSYKNYSIVKAKESVLKKINRRIKEVQLGKKRKLRKDAVQLVGIVLTGNLPESGNKELDAAKTGAYFAEATKFFCERYGYDNVKYSVAHVDEDGSKYHHLHIGIVPVTSDGRLAAKELFDKNQLIQLHTDFAKEVGSKYGLERGESKNDSKKKYVEMSRLKQQTAERAAAAAAAKEKELLENIKDIKFEREVLSSLEAEQRKKVAALNKEHEELQKKLAEAKSELLRIKEIIKKGNEYYTQLQQQLEKKMKQIVSSDAGKIIEQLKEQNRNLTKVLNLRSAELAAISSGRTKK